MNNHWVMKLSIFVYSFKFSKVYPFFYMPSIELFCNQIIAIIELLKDKTCFTRKASISSNQILRKIESQNRNAVKMERC